MLSNIGFCFLAFFFLLSCNPSGTQQDAPEEETSSTSIPAPKADAVDDNNTRESTENGLSDWQILQDSLREELLARHTNPILKNSLLQEFYIRGLTKKVGDSVLLELPFDLHGYDAGAPDCYTTLLSFVLPMESSLLFPKALNCKVHEFGCVDEEFEGTTTLSLKEENANYVIYASEESPETLILSKNNEVGGSYAFYFPAALFENSEEFIAFMRDFDPDDYPLTSTMLNSMGYERFLD